MIQVENFLSFCFQDSFNNLFFFFSFAKSEAADSWLALMDRYLTLGDDCTEEKKAVNENINKLIDIYYDALDAPKKGTKVNSVTSIAIYFLHCNSVASLYTG